MAAPTLPTSNSIVIENLKKAGYADPATNQAALVTRATDEWLEEAKNDVYLDINRPIIMHVTDVAICTNGQRRYPNPTGYISGLSLEIVHGSRIGTAQAGTVGTITLAADTDMSEASILGLDIMIYGGTAKGSMSQITAYDNSTKVVIVTPDFNTAPDTTSTYMIIDTYYPVDERDGIYYSDIRIKGAQGIPKIFVPEGDPDNGEFILWPVPYHQTAPFGMIMRYFFDIMELDLTGTAHGTFLKRFRNQIGKKIEWEALKDKDDSRKDRVGDEYEVIRARTKAKEEYGMDMSNLQVRVMDYE